MKLGREEILQELRRFYKLPETRMGPQGAWRDMSLSFGFSAEWVAGGESLSCLSMRHTEPVAVNAC